MVVNPTLLTSQRRWVDVVSTFCVYWVYMWRQGLSKGASLQGGLANTPAKANLSLWGLNPANVSCPQGLSRPSCVAFGPDCNPPRHQGTKACPGGP